MALEQLGTGFGRLTTDTGCDRSIVTDDQIRAIMRDDNALRQRLRAIISELVPNKWGLRGTLFRIVDHAPRSRLLALRDRIRELVK